MALVLVFLLHLLSLFSIALCSDARFYDSSAKFGFALATASNGSLTDLLFQISAPQSAGWGAVGIGDKMDGSLMFIVYPSTHDDGVTVSIRSTSSHNTPSPISSTELTTIDLEVQSSHISESIMTANIICRNCNGKSGGASFNPTSTKQAWIWATGPGDSGGNAIASDSQDVNINQHDNNYGTFYVDMTATKTNSSTIPNVSGSADKNVKSLPSSVPILIIIHAVCLGGAFILLFPIGIVLLRWFNKVKLHWMMQIFATTVCIFGLIFALVFSGQDPEFNTFDEAHQIVGIIAVLALIAQALLGYQHHQGYKKYGQRTIITHSHLWLGRVAILMGMINTALGFSLAGSTWGAVGIAVVIVIIGITLFIVFLVAKRHHRSAMPAYSNSTSPPSIALSGYTTPHTDGNGYSAGTGYNTPRNDGSGYSGYSTPSNGYKPDTGGERQTQGRAFV